MRTLFLTAVFLIAFPVSAAVLSVTPKEISSDGETLVSVVIDTEGDVINALEMNISLPENEARITEVYEGTSFVSFWTSTAAVEDNTLMLSGIIPGGFQGEGTVVSFLVSGRTEGTTRVRIENVSVLRNDGEGSSVPMRLSDTTLIVSDDVSPDALRPDTTPPEMFTVSVLRDASVADGLYVAIFATHDKQTGVASYEIQETRSRIPSPDAWVSAASPYVLQDQTLESRIFVRATDRAGNSVVAQYTEERGLGLLSGALYLILIVLGVLLVFALYVRNTHRKKVGAE